MKRVLSLFDGLGAARIALARANIPVELYIASEVEKAAMLVASHNHADIEQAGDVTKLDGRRLGNIDLLIGGSPCQDFSSENRVREGLEGKKSSLFFEYLRLLNEVMPKFFVLENVASMKRQDRDAITSHLGVGPVVLDTIHISAQSRKRLFWVGMRDGDGYKTVNIPPLEDKNISLWDILEPVVASEYHLDPNMTCHRKLNLLSLNINQIVREERTPEGKTVRKEQSKLMGKDYTPRNATNKAYYGRGINRVKCLMTSPSLESAVVFNGVFRQTTPLEWERLMGLPDNYTAGMSDRQRYHMIGNSFHVDIVVHILKALIAA